MDATELNKEVVDSIEYDLEEAWGETPVSIYLDIERKKKSYLRDLTVPETMRLGAVICQALTELANNDDDVLKAYPEMKPFLEIYGKLSSKLYVEGYETKKATNVKDPIGGK